jgi:mannose/fructose-specific phosphotransferase system component IIA
LIGGWHIASKKDTQGGSDCRFVIAGLNLPVLTLHASLKMQYRKPRRDPKENWKNHG